MLSVASLAIGYLVLNLFSTSANISGDVCSTLFGSLLISALIIFPSLSAMRVIHNFKGVVVYSAVLSVFCALLGMLLSILFSTPVGSTIVAVDLASFLVNFAVGKILRRDR